MRLGINILFLIPSQVGGTETYVLELIKALKSNPDNHTYYLFCNLENRHLFQPSTNLKIITLPIKASIRPLRLITEQLLLPFYLLFFKIKVILFG